MMGKENHNSQNCHIKAKITLNAYNFFFMMGNVVNDCFGFEIKEFNQFYVCMLWFNFCRNTKKLLKIREMGK